MLLELGHRVPQRVEGPGPVGVRGGRTAAPLPRGGHGGHDLLVQGKDGELGVQEFGHRGELKPRLQGGAARGLQADLRDCLGEVLVRGPVEVEGRAPVLAALGHGGNLDAPPAAGLGPAGGTELAQFQPRPLGLVPVVRDAELVQQPSEAPQGARVAQRQTDDGAGLQLAALADRCSPVLGQLWGRLRALGRLHGHAQADPAPLGGGAHGVQGGHRARPRRGVPGHRAPR